VSVLNAENINWSASADGGEAVKVEITEVLVLEMTSIR
jgi:hypothetical protein